MSSLVRARRVTRYNLVDVYLGAAGLLGCGEPLRVIIPPDARHFAKERLRQDVPLVAVQLGASSDTKAWSVRSYARTLNELGRLLPGVQVVLVGVPAERALARELCSACPSVPFVQLIGETSVPELAAVIERCDVLLTGDTGTMHLAGAVGTTTCAIFVGLGNPWETAVYAEGHWALMSRLGCAPCHHFVKCGYPACHEDIPGEWLAELLSRIVGGAQPEDIAQLPRADLYRTRFDEKNGLLDLFPVHRRPPRPHELMAAAYRAVFLESLAGRRLVPEQIWREGEQRYSTLPGRWAELLPQGVVDGLRRLETLACSGEQTARELLCDRPDPVRAKRAGERLQRCDREAFEIARSEPLLAPLGLSLEAALESLPDADLPALALRSAEEYAALGHRAALVRDIIDPTHQGVAP